MTANTPVNPHQQPVIHRYIDQTAWVRACSTIIVQALHADLRSSRNVLLLLSGGFTPIPIFHALAEADLPWPQITVSLVDERIIAAGQPGRNADLLSEHLFTGAAAKARFWPLLDTDLDPTHAAYDASQRLAGESLPISVVVLGMGG
ncbi:MAG TPA: 6-phosphogluconolactonase, partial [Mizugakiibacter sp.]|nr:6-phosphogluconolactonase [Mizugakiibacter sp.]